MNSQTNLIVGDITASEVAVEVINLKNEIIAGEKVIYYQIEDGVENLIGVFYAEAPTIATKTSIRFNAYDAKAKLAVDFYGWLNDHQDDFPMPLHSLVESACDVAGVSFSKDSFQFDDLSVPAFYAEGVTSRQIVSWAAQIAGCFVSCKPNGDIFFDWYRNTTTEIKKTQFAVDSLSKRSYTTDQIMRVQIKQSANDVGVIYPADADGNVFSIQQNGIAALMDSNTLRSIAQHLYDKLHTVTYVPLTIQLPKRTSLVKAGDIIHVTDRDGNVVTTYAMKVYLDAGGTTITSTGDKNYSDKAAVSSQQYKNIPGRLLELELSADGLRLAAKKIENLEIGGRNLIRNSRNLIYKDYGFMSDLTAAASTCGTFLCGEVVCGQ